LLLDYKAAAVMPPVYNTAGRKRGSKNHPRSRCIHTDPIENHIRLTQSQFDEITNDFIQWRWATARQSSTNIVIDPAADQVKMETFLKYMASGGFYRTLCTLNLTHFPLYGTFHKFHNAFENQLSLHAIHI
jgi:hypothetical protein